MLLRCKSLVRPQFEYCIRVWNTHSTIGHGTTREGAKRSYKMIYDYNDLSYVDRSMHKLTLERRRGREAIIKANRGSSN